MNFKPFFAALRFLTLLPISETWCGEENDFYHSPDWYPVVGLGLGLIAAFLDVLLCRLLPVPVASVLLLLAMIAVSGALHLDGLADSADAFFSSRHRDTMLEIMKDSRSGPMGVTAIVSVLLLKLMLLISLPTEWRWQTIVLLPLAGRCSLSLVSSWLPYARKTGTAAFAGHKKNRLRPLIAIFIFLCVSLLLFGGVAGGLTSGLVACSIWGLGSYSRRKIGGFTGDILGAICEVVELVPMFGIIMMARLGGI